MKTSHVRLPRFSPGVIAVTILIAASTLSAQDPSAAPASPVDKQAGGASGTTLNFDALADKALSAMNALAQASKMHGVAVVAFAEGDHVRSWSSKMLVVGSMTNAPSAGGKGDNLLGIAYAKAAEMASTLSNSGSGSRPPYTGEFGWQGGVVGSSKSGTFFAAFSGGRSEDDVRVSKAGLAILLAGL
jgi:hypothetical protein